MLRSLGDSGNYAEVAVRATELALSISIVTPTGTTSVTTLGTLEPVSGNGGNTIPLVVRIDTNEALVEQLVNMGIDEMREWCDNADSKSGEIGVKNPDLSAARTISCFPKKYNETNPAWIQVGKRMGASVTFVRTEKFLVARSRREKIYDTEMVVYDSEPEALWEPRDIPFLRRRRPYVSFWALVFILGIATGLRTVARLFRRNIIARYVEGIVLRVLNVPCCDSLLAHHDAIVNGSFSAKRESCYGQDDDFDSYPQSGVGIDCDEPGDPSQPDQI